LFADNEDITNEHHKKDVVGLVHVRAVLLGVTGESSVDQFVVEGNVPGSWGFLETVQGLPESHDVAGLLVPRWAPYRDRLV